MTDEKQELKTRHVTVKISTTSKTDSETQSITVDIMDNKTSNILKSFTVMESNDLKKVWLVDTTTIKSF